MDDNKSPTTDANTPPDLPPTGEEPEVPKSDSDTASQIDENTTLPQKSDTASQSDLEDSSVETPPPPFPAPGDAPPLPPPLSPDEVKTPAQPLPTPISEEKPIDSPVLTENEDREIVKPQKPIDSEGLEPEKGAGEATQQDSDTVSPENSDIPTQKKSDTKTQPIAPPSPEQAEPTIPDESVAPPKKGEMPVEAKFPGQPLPSKAQKNLEEKAKEMIDKDGGVKNRKVKVAGKPKSNVAKTLVGILLMVLVGGGVFVGTNLAGKSTEDRSQAGWDGNTYFCESSDNPYDCGGSVCGGFTEIWKSCKMEAGGTCWKKTKTCEDNYRCSGGSCEKIDGGGGGNGEGDDDWCRNGQNEDHKRIFKGDCIVIICPYGDTNNDGHCRNDDQGANYKGRMSCEKAVSTLGVKCGQVDPVDQHGSYCVTPANKGVIAINLNGCAEPPPTGTPTPTPSPTPPTSKLVCSDITMSPQAPSLGDKMTISCTGKGSVGVKVDHYKFQYSVAGGDWKSSLESTTKGVSKRILIKDSGKYKVRCKACEADNSCTKWQTL